MFDRQGRLWYTARIRPADNPAFCKAGSSLPSAKLTPADRSGRQLGSVRSGDQAELDDRHLLCDASPAVRRGRQQHAVDQQRRRRRSGGLAQHKNVGPNARRAKIARLDGAGAGHQRQRQARCLCGIRAESGHGAERRKLGHFVRSQRRPPTPARTRGSTRLSTAWRSEPTGWSGAACWASPAESCG